MPGPNGEPSGMSAGAWAVTRALQHGHVARNRLIRVVIGLIGGRSTWSQALASSWPAFAGFLHPCRLRDVPLLTARRRQRRVVRRLRRLAVLGFDLGDSDQQRIV